MGAVILNPLGKARQRNFALAERSDSKIHNLGVLSNQKVNADAVLDRLIAVISEKVNVEVKLRQKKLIQSRATPADIMDAFCEKCEAVIVGVGD